MALQFILSTAAGREVATFSGATVDACWDAFEAAYGRSARVLGTKRIGHIEPLVILG